MKFFRSTAALLLASTSFGTAISVCRETEACYQLDTSSQSDALRPGFPSRAVQLLIPHQDAPTKLDLTSLLSRSSNGVDIESDNEVVREKSEPKPDSFHRLNHKGRMRMHLIHGCLSTVAFVGLFPTGGILIRFFHFRGVLWVHAVLQLLAYAFYIPAFAMGFWFTNAKPYSRVNKHPVIGIVVFVLLFVQPFLGWMHHRVYKKTGRRSFWSHLHTNIGRAAIILGIINGAFGLIWVSATWVSVIAYSVVASLAGAAYIGAALFGEARMVKRSKVVEKEGSL